MIDLRIVSAVKVRQRVLTSAYVRAMKDPFPQARQAGILAMAATHNYFTLQESAHRLLPALCALTMDPDKGVRDQVVSPFLYMHVMHVDTGHSMHFISEHLLVIWILSSTLQIW